MSHPKNILVVGATGGTGLAVVNRLLAEGHRVTAFSRHATRLNGLSDRLTTVDGDATRADDVNRVVPGHDAVIVTLGITENPLRVRLLGAGRTADKVRSEGTQRVIDAMQANGMNKLVVLSSFGLKETRHKLRLSDRLVFSLLLKPQIRDTETQESHVRASGLDWVLVQPVHLNDEDTETAPMVSTAAEVGAFKVSRKQVAAVLTEALHREEFLGRSVAVSGPLAA